MFDKCCLIIPGEIIHSLTILEVYIMKRNNSQVSILTLSNKSLIDASQFIPDLKTVWQDMPAPKAEYVREEIRQLAAAKMAHAQSGLALGQHLENIYQACEPYSGVFRRICKGFSFSERTSYRYMETWEHAQKAFQNKLILNAVMARGLKIISYDKHQPLGKYTKAVKLLPPPRNPSPAQANAYVAKLEQKQKEIRDHDKNNPSIEASETTPVDKETLLKSNYRSIRNALKILRGRAKRNFLESLFGMALTEAGIEVPTSFSPKGISEEYRQGPGRPRSFDTEEAA